MDQRLSFVADGRLARRVDDLAREYDIPTEEVLRQLVAVGLEEIDGDGGSNSRRTGADGSRLQDD